MKQFWMVWNIGGNPPRVQHGYEHVAISEAERLARANPGETFVVLEATHARKVSDMHSLDLRQASDEIPF